ncbi:hypothetical protein BMI86_14035 [Thioclava sp. DLFJ5-1]|uniref:TadE/TadG family type IV pilus assembly protein n=2 Tax=Thioclava TaxID=285107 RepID=UPI000997EAD0|nr:hypothetical protein [Thioclava sp. F28-4]OOY05680.1 hypothetical protein BMI87_06560 [Thioclava sp. F28-4]OOY10130.1 hypothetical protein BMI89_04865 [Thioclava sp. F36-7]OOY19739.1 hypothetical protein BMI86_14035 [Thioclava sp. DLFJ5-1]
MVMAKMRNLLRRLRDDETGSIPIEGLMAFIMLSGWLILSIEMYDVFKIRGAATRANVTVSDLISRERDPIGPKFVAGIKQVYDFATGNSDPSRSWMRVTLVSCWDDPLDLGHACNDPTEGSDAKKVKLDDSYATGLAQSYTQEALDLEADRIPVLAAGDQALIVETSYAYDLPFKLSEAYKAYLTSIGEDPTKHFVGFHDAISFDNFIVTRPRVARLTWSDAD